MSLFQLTEVILLLNNTASIGNGNTIPACWKKRLETDLPDELKVWSEKKEVGYTITPTSVPCACLNFNLMIRRKMALIGENTQEACFWGHSHTEASFEDTHVRPTTAPGEDTKWRPAGASLCDAATRTSMNDNGMLWSERFETSNLSKLDWSIQNRKHKGFYVGGFFIRIRVVIYRWRTGGATFA